MAVRTEKRLSRHAETLQVHLMRYAVAGSAVDHTVLRSDTSQESVIVSVLEIRLQQDCDPHS